MEPVVVLTSLAFMLAVFAYIFGRFAKNALLATLAGIASSILALWGIIPLAIQALSGQPVTLVYGLLYIDAFSALMVLTIVAVVIIVMGYSIPYVLREVRCRHMSQSQSGAFYFWSNVLILAMLATVMTNNLGSMWALVEATTLASAPLVSLYGTRTSIEAAWKYLILATVGISIALLATLLLYSASTVHFAGNPQALNWTFLHAHAAQLDPALVKLAFIFAIVGYGTKTGLAPMHNWLPDAHSQAPTPSSALLSGSLLICALFGIFRFSSIARLSIGNTFPSTLLIAAGLFSVAFVIPFMIRQEDIKRLLAYSSVEHMGIIVLAIGVGGPFGIFAAILHVLYHALTKSTLFCTIGEVVHHAGTRSLTQIRALATTAPLVATYASIGILAIVGSPPFAIFLSKWLLITALIRNRLYVPVIIFLALLAVIFATFIMHMLRINFENSSEQRQTLPKISPPIQPIVLSALSLFPNEQSTANTIPDQRETAESTRTAHQTWDERFALLWLFMPMLAIVMLGIWIPDTLQNWIQMASEVIR